VGRSGRRTAATLPTVAAARWIAAQAGRLPGARRGLRAANPLLARLYPTPKVDVRAVIVRDGDVLLVRHADNGRWAPPGGFADIGEAPATSAEREVLEETGRRVRAVKLLAVIDCPSRRAPATRANVYRLFFLCAEIADPRPRRPDHEVDAQAFFAADGLPPLCPKRFTTEQAALVYRHVAEPERPTDFAVPSSP